MELASRAVHALETAGVPLVKKALAKNQEVGAWLLDLCYTELRVRAKLLRPSVQYVAVANALYGKIRPELPSGLQVFNDENCGNIVEAASTVLFLRPVTVGPDWAGIRALLTSVVQLDPELCRVAAVWAPPAPPVSYLGPPVATSGDTVEAPTGCTSGK